MSIFSEYLHGMIDYDELRQAYNFLERKDEMDDKKRCFKEGTGEGDCAECDHRWECSGSPYCEEDEEE